MQLTILHKKWYHVHTAFSQLVIYCDNVGIKFLFNSTMKIPAITGTNGKPDGIFDDCEILLNTF